MQHCSSPLFINDSFCPDCGDKIDNTLSIKSLEQHYPDIIEALLSHCPDANIYTGWVEKTHHYKRVYRSGGNNSETLYYSYWFLTLNNEKDEPFTISISSEDSSFDSVTKGDVMTFLQPTSYNLNYKLADANDKHIVTHTEAATAVVFHRNSGQESILNPVYQPEAFSKFGTFGSTLFFSAIAAISGLFFDLYNLEAAAVITALLTLFGSIYRISSKTKTFAAETARLDEIKRTVKQILGVSNSDMGYDRRGRQAKNDDVYCICCEQLINSHYHYCHCCGQSQLNEAPAIFIEPTPKLVSTSGIDNETASADSAAMTATTTSTGLSSEQSHAMTATSDNVTPITSARRMTRRDKILQVCAPFSTVDNIEHQHKHLFAKNYQCTLSTSSSIVRVTDKEVGTSVSDDTNVTTRTTRTDYRNGYGSVRSEYRTETSSHRQRNSNLYGELTVETPEGEVQSFKAARSLLGSADIGDWILLGSSKVEGAACRTDYDEFYYNISKDNLIEPESMTRWGRISGKSQTIVILLFALAIGSTIYFHDMMNLLAPLLPNAVWNVVFGLTNSLTLPISYTPMVLFSLFFVAVLVIARMSRNHTKRKLHLALKPLHETLEKCQQTRESFDKI
ncbi:hypothetical protein L2755_20790 [Shewanella abyssi]|uniref:hypothetical protein n=1 Tax=Shewanella abyssi TaxID=311789 RepID=UPI00200DADDE|nr:hypothetical protein [Shewanella abyssi]MCL1052035.1 hypothetical protein [Shewanella abyssi]